jgi:hypothetical protein
MKAARKAEVIDFRSGDMPAPLVPANCRVGGDYMPLYGEKLFNSKFNDEAPLAAKWAGLRLWYEAWVGEVTSRLPSSDKRLADLAGYGKNMREWRRVKTWALHGFVLCRDGYYYHPVQAAEAIKVMTRRIKDANRKRGHDAEAAPETIPGGVELTVVPAASPSPAQAAAEALVSAALLQKSGESAATLLQSCSESAAKVATESVQNQTLSGGLPLDFHPQLKGREVNKERTSAPDGSEGADGATARPAAPAASKPPLSPTEALRAAIWDEGRGILLRIAPAMEKATPGTLIGSLAKELGGGIDGGTQAVQKVRDVERLIISEKLAGYAIAADAVSRSTVVENYIWGIIAGLKADAKKAGGKAKGKGGASSAPLSTAEQLQQLLQQGMGG